MADCIHKIVSLNCAEKCKSLAALCQQNCKQKNTHEGQHTQIQIIQLQRQFLSKRQRINLKVVPYQQQIQNIYQNCVQQLQRHKKQLLKSLDNEILLMQCSNTKQSQLLRKVQNKRWDKLICQQVFLLRNVTDNYNLNNNEKLKKIVDQFKIYTTNSNKGQFTKLKKKNQQLNKQLNQIKGLKKQKVKQFDISHEQQLDRQQLLIKQLQLLQKTNITQKITIKLLQSKLQNLQKKKVDINKDQQSVQVIDKPKKIVQEIKVSPRRQQKPPRQHILIQISDYQQNQIINHHKPQRKQNKQIYNENRINIQPFSSIKDKISNGIDKTNEIPKINTQSLNNHSNIINNNKSNQNNNSINKQSQIYNSKSQYFEKNQKQSRKQPIQQQIVKQQQIQQPKSAPSGINFPFSLLKNNKSSSPYQKNNDKPIHLKLTQNLIQKDEQYRNKKKQQSNKKSTRMDIQQDGLQNLKDKKIECQEGQIVNQLDQNMQQDNSENKSFQRKRFQKQKISQETNKKIQNQEARNKNIQQPNQDRINSKDKDNNDDDDDSDDSDGKVQYHNTYHFSSFSKL